MKVPFASVVKDGVEGRLHGGTDRGGGLTERRNRVLSRKSNGEVRTNQVRNRIIVYFERDTFRVRVAIEEGRHVGVAHY